MPTYYTTRGQSFIDLTLTDLNSTNFVQNWSVLEVDSLYDHRYIEFMITDECPKIEFRNTIKYVIKGANWESFTEELLPVIQQLNYDLSHIQTEAQFNVFIENFNINLTQVCESFKKESLNKFKKSNNWWNNELTLTLQKVNNARRKYQRNQTERREQLKQNYLEIKQSYKRLLLKSKTDSWNRFIELNTREKPWGLVNALSRQKLKAQKINEIINSNGKSITDNRKIAETLLNKLFQDDEYLKENSFHREVRARVHSGINTPNDYKFTETEVTEIVNQQNNSKSPGEDGFNADIIKNSHRTDNLN
jgi:hypothetical protein